MGFKKKRFLRLEIDKDKIKESKFSWETNEKESQLKLLRAYAPRMHFAKDERFFPMNVQDYIDASALRYQQRFWPDLTIDDKSILQANLDSQKSCENPTKEYLFTNFYLQFVHELNWNSGIRIGTILLVLILLGAFWLAIQPEQLPLIEFPSKLGSFKLKFGIFAILTILGVSFQYNRKVFLGLLVFLFSIAFFGEPLIIKPGLVFLSLTLALTTFWFINSWLQEWFMETVSRKASTLFTLGTLYILTVPLLAYISGQGVRLELSVLYWISAVGWIILTQRGFRTVNQMLKIWGVHALFTLAVFFFLGPNLQIAVNYQRPASEWLILAGLMTMFPYRMWIRRMHWSEVSTREKKKVDEIIDVKKKKPHEKIKFLGQDRLIEMFKGPPQKIDVLEATKNLPHMPQKLKQEAVEFKEELTQDVYENKLDMSLKERFEAATGVSFHDELMPIIVFFIIIHFFVLLHVFGRQFLTMFGVTGENELISAVYVMQIALSFSALLWYFLDPLPNPTIFGSNMDKCRHLVRRRQLKRLSGQSKLLLPFRLVALDLDYSVRTSFAWLMLYNRYFLLVIISAAVWLLGTFLNYSFSHLPVFEVVFPVLYRLSLLVVFIVIVILVGDKSMGFLLDLLSIQPDSLSNRAYTKYRNIRWAEKTAANDWRDKIYTYGRVFKDDNWTILFYQFFYAYNDWRSAVGGINNHEGDWEAVAIYVRCEKETLLKKLDQDDELDKPIGMALSQHHAGVFKFWEDWYWEKDKEKSECPIRPNIYVARGSHANYSKPDNYPTAKFFEGGPRKVIASVDNFIRSSRGQIGFNKGQGLPEEFADGGGPFFEDDRWEIKLINEISPGWMQYRGLWGSKVTVKDESGPLGPYWAFDRENLDNLDEEGWGDKYGRWTRLRWDLLGWKNALLLDMVGRVSLSPKERQRAFKALSND